MIQRAALDTRNTHASPMSAGWPRHPSGASALKRATPKLLVLEASGIVEIDFTAAQMLLELIAECRRQHAILAVARLESTRAQQAFERFGIYDVLPKDHVFRSVDEAVRKLAPGSA